MNYYNEFDPNAAAWLRELISAGEIPPGHVDETDIRDVNPDDLRGYVQCHFFAGIGGWPLALRLAGVPPERPLWTGSCPCQPFSAAGKRKGVDDERHLWPHWFHLISVCRPAGIFGEQVASALDWYDLVSADLEGEGYAVGAADLCAAGYGAPHIRQRLFFGAHDTRPSGAWLEHASGDGREERRPEPGERSVAGGRGADGLGHSDDAGPQERRGGPDEQSDPQGRQDAERPGGLPGVPRGLADAERNGQHRRGGARSTGRQESSDGCFDRRSIATDGHWRDADWLFCRDGKWRPVEPGTFPLAHGVSGRVGLLRGYGNAIVPQVAAEFIRAFEEVRASV